MHVTITIQVGDREDKIGFEVPNKGKIALPKWLLTCILEVITGLRDYQKQ